MRCVLLALLTDFAHLHADLVPLGGRLFHSVGDAPSLVAGAAGGPEEIPCQAPVHILQAPRREVNEGGM